MAEGILFDTNVLIDVLAKREPFVLESKAIWDAHDDRKINGYVTATSLTDLFYILRKRTNQQQA